MIPLKGNRKSQKLFPFVKKWGGAQNMGCIHLKQIIELVRKKQKVTLKNNEYRNENLLICLN